MLRRMVWTRGRKFWPLRDAIAMRRKGKLYGRRLRRSQTPMWYFRPPWWFVGHPDWLEITRAYEREFGQLDDATRHHFESMRREWHEFVKRGR
jgi:hypothetical protein